jgi:proline iminopeptidase
VIERAISGVGLAVIAGLGWPGGTQAAEARPPVSEGFVPTPDGVRLFYEAVGDGRRTVLVPARLFLRRRLGGDPALVRGRRLIFYDMRNRGRSDAVADHRTLSIDQDVADLETVRRHFGVERASLIGYSYLGRMVIEYALAHPDAVERIVQLGPVPMKFGTTYPPGLTEEDAPSVLDPEALAAVRQLRERHVEVDRPREYCEAEWKVTRVALIGDPSRAEAVGPPSPCDMPNEWPINLARHFQHHFASIQRRDVKPEDLRGLAVPVLTIHGTRDRNAPYGGGREWALRIPRARLLSVAGGAHNTFDDHPEIVLPAIARFLDGSWPEGAEEVSSLDPGGP